MTAVIPPKNLWHTMPGWGIVANLLPPELLDARRVRFLRRVVFVAAGVVLLIVVLAYGAERLRAHSAGNDLASEKAKAGSLTQQQTKYSNVVQIKNSISQVDSQVSGLMTDDVQMSQLVSTMHADLLPGMAITQVKTSLNYGAAVSDAGKNTSSNLDTTGYLPIGDITISGTAIHFSDVSSYVTKLNTVKGLSQAYPTSNALSTTAFRGVAFTLEITLNNQALSHRFDHIQIGAK